ncbi:OLC1v1003246C1 [Oldenlandia corymbosa var. corymbosa]|uniref:OLC1v1003246C1 n=1 Tax=Oldenlandia corymbosa var. corymbosa TaxID=529605 RepID=A0AAV1DBZ2_OLDCO|nr:OLC1v1003246C1 [Oldenlandia corymbosa var. corymbosa]
MDPLNLHNIKVEKANAKLRYRRMKKITALFRLLELCIFFFIISRFTTQLPIAFKLSGEFFRGISVFAVSPRFVFIVGNVIVIILFLKSGQLSGKDGNFSGDGSSKPDLYEEYVKTCEKSRTVYKELESKNIITSSVKKQRKQSISVSREIVHPESAHINSEEKKMKLRRSQSENPKTMALKPVKEEEEEEAEDNIAGRKLRRSVTVRYRESVNSDQGKPAGVGSRAEDQMSNEEFRRTVEAFIARQQRFLREED